MFYFSVIGYRKNGYRGAKVQLFFDTTKFFTILLPYRCIFALQFQ